MGLEYARQLAGRGYDLIMVSNCEDELEAAKTSIEKDYQVKVTARFQDLAKADAADLLFEWCTVEQCLLPDIVINNAGMFFFKELKEEDLTRVEAMLNLHITTVTRTCLLFGNAMKKRGNGRLLIMSSMAARIPAPGITVYSATKAYLKSFGKSLSFEMKPYGVSVTTVCPAAIATPLYKLSEKKMKLGIRTGFIRTPQWLVHRALKAMFRGRRTISPAFMNFYLPPMIAMLPGGVEQAIWEKLR